METIRRSLRPQVLGCRIDEVVCGDPRVFRGDPQDLASAIRGQTIRDVLRRGKFLILALDTHYCVFHLGMTGQITVRDPRQPDSPRFLRQPETGLQRIRQHVPDQHTHFQLRLGNGRRILYRDTRKFGRVAWLPRKGDTLELFFQKLGLEPFTAHYNLPAFLEKFGKRKLRVKSLLLDQRFVAGVGNIYADEALFEAGIHPARRLYSLRRKEKERLFKAIPKVLERGIHYGGTTLRDYINSDGEEGSHQNELRVYGRQGEPCRRCGTPIQKMVVSQRGTHFCPKCQPRRN